MLSSRCSLVKGVLFNRRVYSSCCSQINRISSVNNIHNKPTLLKFSTGVDSQKTTKKTPELIYNGELTSYIKKIKYFSFTTTALGLAAQPYMYSKTMELGGMSLMFGVCGIIGFFTYLTPVLLQYAIRKYVTKIEYEPSTKTYTAYTMTFFMGSKKLDFTPDDVEEPDVPGMFTSFLIKKKPVLVNLETLKNSEHYVTIMGYDKPLDFLNTSGEEPSNKKI